MKVEKIFVICFNDKNHELLKYFEKIHVGNTNLKAHKVTLEGYFLKEDLNILAN